MPSLQIKNFKGINLEEGLWSQGFARYASGVDIFGLQDNTNASQLSIPGVLQPMLTTSAGTEAAGPNDIKNATIRWLQFWPGTGTGQGQVYGTDDGTRAYVRVTGTWTLTSWTPSSMAGGGGLKAFGNSLWVGQNAALGRLTTGGYTQAWNNFTTAGTSPRPMVVYAGNLYVGNDNYVSKVDASYAWTATALTLPANFIVKAMETFADRIYISADDGTFTRIFVWDGTSTTFQSFFDLRDEASAPHLKVNEGKLWAVAARGAATPGTPIYIFNGYLFEKIMMLPIQVSSYGDILGTYRGGLLICSSDTGSAKFEQGVAGIWMINRYDNSHPYQAAIAFDPGDGVNGTLVGSVYSSGSTLYAGTFRNTGSNYEAYELQTTVASSPTSTWHSLPIDAGDATRLKSWNAIKVDHEIAYSSGVATPAFRVQYRVDYATSWTSLITVNPSTNPPTAYFPIGASGRVIEIRLDFTTSFTRIHGFTIDYELGQQ